MKNSIKDFIQQSIEISDKSYQEFLSIFKEVEFPKSHVISKKGDIHHKFYLLKKGVACSQLDDKNGNKHIRTLFTVVSAIANLPSLVYKTPSPTEYVCITKCTLLEANFADFENMIKKYHDVSISYNKFLQRVYTNIEEKNTDLATLNAESRYLKLRKKEPDIENKIPLYYIAAYLNITPIQLSRIRKKIYSK